MTPGGEEALLGLDARAREMQTQMPAPWAAGRERTFSSPPVPPHPPHGARLPERAQSSRQLSPTPCPGAHLLPLPCSLDFGVSLLAVKCPLPSPGRRLHFTYHLPRWWRPGGSHLWVLSQEGQTRVEVPFAFSVQSHAGHTWDVELTPRWHPGAAENWASALPGAQCLYRPLPAWGLCAEAIL